MLQLRKTRSTSDCIWGQRVGWRYLRHKESRSHGGTTTGQLHFTTNNCHNWVSGAWLQSGVIRVGEEPDSHACRYEIINIPQAAFSFVWTFRWLKKRTKQRTCVVPSNLFIYFSALILWKVLNIVLAQEEILQTFKKIKQFHFKCNFGQIGWRKKRGRNYFCLYGA